MLSKRLTLCGAFVFLGILSLTALRLGPDEYAKIAKAQLSQWTVEDAPEEVALDTYEFQEDSLEDQYPSVSSTGFDVPAYNIYKHNATTEQLHTTMFIAFGRNWFVLHQCVVSYIAAGWPAQDITIFDNSGTQSSNALGRLGVDNPAYVNVTRLRELGVKYESVPTLLTFSQLQNFFLSTAMSQNLTYYFWSHMDVSILADEEMVPYQSFYSRIIDDLLRTTGNMDNWVLHFYAFDWLTLVNTKSYELMGGWDTAIPYYTSDCDFYSRVTMWGEEFKNGFDLLSVEVGAIYDMLTPMRDLSRFFPDPGTVAKLGSERYKKLKRTLRFDSDAKGDGDGRNSWQNRQKGGDEEPYFKFGWVQDETFRRMNDLGRDMFELKWRTGGTCPAFDVGRRLKDMYAT